MTPEERIINLLEMIAIEKRTCRMCPAKIYFLRTRDGALAPYTAAGVNHFLDCPGVRPRGANPRQDALFPATANGTDALEPKR